jgi:hypothetical protein
MGERLRLCVNCNKYFIDKTKVICESDPNINCTDNVEKQLEMKICVFCNSLFVEGDDTDCEKKIMGEISVGKCKESVIDEISKSFEKKDNIINLEELIMKIIEKNKEVFKKLSEY